MRQPLRTLAWLCLILMMAGCSQGPQTRLLLKSEVPRAPSAQIGNVPFFPQTEYHCGPSALASVFHYRGLAFTPDELAKQVYLPGRKGSLQLEMVAAVRAAGLLPYPVKPRLDALLKELEQGNPVLVLQNLGLSWAPYWHYAVAIGYDLSSRELILHSGKTAALRRPLSTFERTWSRAGHWGLVITDPANPPVTAEPLALLKTALELEEVGKQRPALAAYQALTQRWPALDDGWLALANAAYGQQQFDRALTAYQQALAINPEEPLIWNNQAYALKASGCAMAAQASARCATRLAPHEGNFQQTLEEMYARPGAQETQCPQISCPVD